MSKNSNVLIQQLLEAEEESDRIVKRARENRIKKLKDAVVSAEEEIKLFRDKEEKQFKKEFEERYGQEDSTQADLDELTKKEIDLVKKDYKANKDAVITFLLKRTVDINMSLQDVQKRYVKDMAAGTATGYV